MNKEITQLAMENRRLAAELKQKNQEIEMLLAVSRGVSQSLDLPRIMGTALEKVVEAMGVEVGFLYLLEDGKLVLQANYGLTPEISEKMKVIELADVAGDGVGVFGVPLIVNSSGGSLEHGKVALAKFGYQSYACVQLAAAGESTGIMGVAATIEHDFTRREIDLLNAIGREISLAVCFAHLYEEASRARALKRRDDLRAELLADVSHELRTPLSAIKGFASALLQEDVSFDEATRREFIQTIDTEADRLNMLIKELLSSSCLESEILKLNKERRNIKDVVNSLRDRLLVLTARRKLSVAIPDLPPVAIDEIRIGQVITNLVENAVKYSEGGTRVTLEARAVFDSVVVSVEDEGVGIPVTLREKVFERFYRVKKTAATGPAGTGLGLYVCRRIIEAHGGRIWVESKIGEGSRFNFSLPVK
jgi:K+-sensing histidine kinase KdpD